MNELMLLQLLNDHMQAYYFESLVMWNFIKLGVDGIQTHELCVYSENYMFFRGGSSGLILNWIVTSVYVKVHIDDEFERK